MVEWTEGTDDPAGVFWLRMQDQVEFSWVSVSTSPIHGAGVFVTQSIRRGTVLLRLNDSRIIDVDHPVRPEAGESEEHRDFLPDGTIVLMPSPERYINHSCTPNCYIYSADRERFLLAKRDLVGGEEVLIDYALNAVGGDEWECRCGAPGCRGLHKCDFFCLPIEVQHENLPYLDPWFASVHASRIRHLLAASSIPRSADFDS